MKLSRLSSDEFGCFSQLLRDDSTLLAVTLEHSYPLENGGYAPKIPVGSYVCVRGTHQLHNGVPFETFEITGVPGHTGLLFHKGNLERDSEGCVLLGQTQSGAAVLHSEAAFEQFMAVQEGLDSFPLEVVSDVAVA